MDWYVKTVQRMYPSLTQVLYSILYSKLNAWNQEFNFNLEEKVMNKDPFRQPVSLTFAIDPFSINMKLEDEDGTSFIQTYPCDEREGMIF